MVLDCGPDADRIRSACGCLAEGLRVFTPGRRYEPCLGHMARLNKADLTRRNPLLPCPALHILSTAFDSTSDLAVVPELISESASAELVVIEDPEDLEENAQETAEANEENALVAADGGDGLLGDQGLVDADIAAEVAIEEAEEEAAAEEAAAEEEAAAPEEVLTPTPTSWATTSSEEATEADVTATATSEEVTATTSSEEATATTAEEVTVTTP